MSSIHAALAEALPLVNGAVKDAENPHFRSKYADLGSVIDAIRPVAEKGIWFRQAPKENDGGALIETFYVHSSGELSAGETFVPADKRNAQGFGSAMTYARRYGLMAAFGIAPEDDDGNAATAAPPPKAADRKSKPPHANDPITDEQRDVIQALAPSAGRTVKEICTLYEIASLKELTAGKAAKLIERLEGDSKARAEKPQADDILDDEVPY